MNPDIGRFSEFLQEAHGYCPFPWQERLLARVIRRTAPSSGQTPPQAWPEAIALPTAAGKTTCIDIAVFALACQEGLRPEERHAPRRIIFVVDRRVIVDEAYEHAKALARKLFDAKDGVLKDVADALRRINYGRAQPPLTCHQLRGGMYRDDAWARTPVQPCVIATTVDQIGSRLLFRTYGRSNKSWPIHAGLAANDALILLDEAHCANPFMQTMKAIARYRGAGWARKPLDAPFCFTVMSATPPAGITDVFSLDMNEAGEDLRDCPMLRRRIASRKPAVLAEATKAQGKKAISELAVELVTHAADLARDNRSRIVIFANRVATARRVFELLEDARNGSAVRGAGDIVRKVQRKLPPQYEAILLTGRMRPIDRDGLLRDWVPSMCLDGPHRGLSAWFGASDERPQLPYPVFVVSTQCLEVGANLDFEGIVSECASLDALRQRFGRVDRVGRAALDRHAAPLSGQQALWVDVEPMGRSGPACRGVIVIRKDQIEATTPDPVYGEAIAHTWQWLNKHATDQDLNGVKEIDFGIGALHPLVAQLTEEQLRTLVLPAPDAPVMLPAHVDCWAQTSPIPRPDPDVAVFLRGIDRKSPEVQVCWRGDIPDGYIFENYAVGDPSDGGRREEVQFEDRVRDAVSLCPPTTGECMPVPLHIFRRWWAEEPGQDEPYGLVSDLEADEQAKQEPDSAERSGGAVALVWRGPEDSRLLRSVADLRNGDTVVIPAALRGWEVFGRIGFHRHDEANGLLGSFHAAADVGDVCRFAATQRPLLRLHRRLVETWPESHGREELLKMLASDAEDLDNGEIQACLDAICAQGALPQGFHDMVNLLLQDRAARWVSHPFGGLVIHGRRAQNALAAENIAVTLGESFTSEDESSSITTPVELTEHCANVAVLAAHWGERCGFPTEIVQSLRLAGEAHDLGKSDVRYQAFLHGGNRLRASLASKVYAKSAGLNEGLSSISGAWRKSNLPEGFRHEQLSVALLDRAPDLLAGDGDRDLVLHLVGCHHGRCRPLADVVIDDAPPEMNLPAASVMKTISAHDRSKWIPLHRLDSGVAERFWRLIHRYGWWGLAWLEAVFMLADHRQSEAESDRSSKKGHPGSVEAWT